MKSTKKIISFILTVLVLITMFSFTTSALDISEEGVITIDYTYNDVPLDDVSFKVYQVAQLEEDGQYNITNQFSDVDIDFQKFNSSSYLLQIKNELEHCVDCEMLKPVYNFITDDTGEYTVEGLELGFYYITAQPTDDGVHAYYSEPILIFVGQFDVDTNKWLYEFSVKPKISVVDLEKQSKVTVVKKWENIDSALIKPKSIDVQLLCDGKVYDTVTLSDKNLWSHTWTELDNDRVWAVYEKTQNKDYEVSYSKDYCTFSITNTYIGESDDTIPDTGTKMYLVPIIAGFGIFLLVLGVTLRKKEK